MNTQLIPVFAGTIASQSVQLVNARELHGFLEIGKEFANWIKDRISQYDFIENQDFIAICQNRQIGHGKGKTDYHLTLDMAKELSMVERNEKGKQARRYFIDCEKQLHQAKPYGLKYLPSDTLTLADFISYQNQIANFTEQLHRCHIVLSAEECLKLDLNKTLAKIQQEEREKQEFFKVTDQIIQMEFEGRPRYEIVKVTGKSFNNVRQVIFNARRDGLLPAMPIKQGGAA